MKQPGRVGRPRSEQARSAVLHAVDDLLVEVGYAAMTMKGIAERAGVGRQTVYRWWATKAEVLFEASVYDAEQELAISPTGDPLDDLTAYLDALIVFLTRSPAGAGYRALIGEAQHDRAVAALIATTDVLTDSAAAVLSEVLPGRDARDAGSGGTDAVDAASTAGGSGVLDTLALQQMAAQLVGPVFFWLLSGRDAALLSPRDLAAAFLAEQHLRS